MRKKTIMISAICISIVAIIAVISLSLIGLLEEKNVTREPAPNKEGYQREKDVISESSKEPTFTEPSVKETNDKTATVEETEHTVSQSEEAPKETLPAESSKVDTAAKTPTTTDKNSSQEETTLAPSTDTGVSEESAPVEEQPPMATADDCAAIADAIIRHINSNRSAPASKLPGLTKYAEYRSRQLVSNFSHDTFDERAAATALQYGRYIDPPLYGMTGEPYYEADAREAIAMAGYVGTVDYVAKKITELVKGSPSHWAYVGSSEYRYIAVGVTYESGMWYCDIAMATEDTDNK